MFRSLVEIWLLNGYLQQISELEIEFVNSWPHLGHVLKANNDDIDIDNIWNALCGQLTMYYGHLFPVLKLKLIKTFCYSL